MNAKLLLIDTDAAIDEALAATLRLRGYDVIRMSSGAEALTALEHEEFEAVVTDIDMPGMTGFEFCRRAQTAWPHVPVVLVTASGSMETAVSAIRAGAYDFISKPIRTQELLVTLARALEHRRLKEENKQLRDTVARNRPPIAMIGRNPAMLEWES